MTKEGEFKTFNFENGEEIIRLIKKGVFILLGFLIGINFTKWLKIFLLEGFRIRVKNIVFFFNNLHIFKIDHY